MRVSDYIMEYLVDYGIKDIFTVPGGGSVFLNDSVNINKNINYYCCHHEQAVGYATESYARRKGILGVSLVTSGPGGTNIISSVTASWLDSVPHLILSGQVYKNQTIGNSNTRQVGIQEINIVDIIKPITKYAVMIRNHRMIKYHLQKAIYLATHDRPGPVWLDIPVDIQKSEIRKEELFEFKYPNREREVPNLKPITKIVAELIFKSKRPLIHIGQGIRISNAIKEFNKLILFHKIPFITSRNANDIVSSDNPHYIGRSGTFGQRAANHIINEADMYLAIGTSLSMGQTGYRTKEFAQNAYKIMVDIDDSVLNKRTLDIDIKIKSDANEFLKGLNRELDGVGLDIHKWRRYCQTLRDRYPVVLPEYKKQKKWVNSYYFIDVLSNLLTEEDTIVTDMGFAFQCSHQAFKIKEGQRFYTSGGLSAMGWGLPAAIGASIATNKKRVICISGDGGLQMNVQELATVMHNKLPVKLFILNNRGYLTMKQTFEQNFGNERIMGCTKETGLSFPDYKKLSDAHSIKYVKLDKHSGMEDIISNLLEYDGPTLCEVIMDPDQPQVPKVIAGDLLHDMYPYIELDEDIAN